MIQQSNVRVSKTPDELNAATADFIVALAAEAVKPWLDGKTVAKRIYVPGKLVNFVVK